MHPFAFESLILGIVSEIADDENLEYVTEVRTGLYPIDLYFPK